MTASAVEAIPERTLFPACLPPCWENPFRLVSWWDVHNFAGTDLHTSIMILERIRCEWIHAQLPGDPLAARILGHRPVVTPQHRESLAGELSEVRTSINNCGLPVSACALWDLRSDLLGYKTPGFDQLSAEQLIGRIEEIQRTIRREMQTTVFLYVQSDNAKLYSNPTEHWETIVSRWPRIHMDVVECSQCLALDRYAAAIFHVLLVAEFGVIQVTDLMNVSGDKPGWSGVQRLENILKKPFKDRTPLEQQHSTLLSEIVPMMVSVRDSMRHKISHVDNKLEWLSNDIGPKIANEIITATRAFMRRLAAELP